MKGFSYVKNHINQMKGKVKWYNETKGFGFIESENGEDIFIHRSGLENSFNGLKPDQEVEFDTQKGNKGMMAVNVKVIT
jgi:cold shock protein